MLNLPSIDAHDSEPVTARNLPRQPRIAYRADDYSSLRFKLLKHLEEAFPAWNRLLETRKGEQDFGVTFVELFSYLADVLGFYQDCRANEAFLRTAVLPESLIDICRLIDYRIAPGASATTLQAFVYKPSLSGTIPAGFKVKTAAKDGRPAVTFETAQDLAGGAALNVLRLNGYDRSTRVLNATGSATSSSVLLDDGYAGLKAGAYVVFSTGPAPMYPVLLTAVTDEPPKRRIIWRDGALPPNIDLAIADLAIYGKPRHAMKLAASQRADEISAGQRSARVANPSVLSLNDHVVFADQGITQAAAIENITGDAITWSRGFNLALRRSTTTIYTAGHDGFAFSGSPIKAGAMQVSSDPAYFPAAGAGDLMILSGNGIIDLVPVASVYGNTYYLNAPVPRDFNNGATLFRVTLPNAETGVTGSASTTMRPLRLNPTLNQLALDKTYDGITPGALVVISDGVDAAVNTIRSLDVDASGRTVLTFGTQLGSAFMTAKTVVHGPFELVMHVDGFNRADGSTTAGITSLTLSGAAPGLKPGAYIVLENVDASGRAQAEGAAITGLALSGGKAVLDLLTPLTNAYPLGSTIVYGNVTPASHGETTVEQTLGSGDQSVANQTFVLHKKPTTYVHDPVGERGVSNTLEIFVEGEKWREVASLAESGPDDHVYTVSLDQNQLMSFTFGDGRYGAKPPTGSNNISVRYRVGLGTAGNVNVGDIRVMSEPLSFLQSTRNPLAASGGADRETPEETKTSAPVTVRTLDRAVSVDDYRDLALSFAGIAKARAAWKRVEGRPVLQLLVATVGGLPLTAPLRNSLSAFLEARRSINYPVFIADYRPQPIRLALEVHVLPNFTRAETKARVEQALGSNRSPDGTKGYFHFDSRGLGERLYLSDVYRIVESIRGVSYVVARAFHPENDTGRDVLEVIHIAGDAVATGGDPTDAAIGILKVQASGGIA